jgi:hypothetical protein
VKYLKLFIFGVLPMIVGAIYMYQQQQDVMSSVRGFCGATHTGQPWSVAQDRAKKADLDIVRGNATTEKIEEWLVQRQSFSMRWGCRVTVDKKGTVLEAKAAEMKPE